VVCLAIGLGVTVHSDSSPLGRALFCPPKRLTLPTQHHIREHGSNETQLAAANALDSTDTDSTTLWSQYCGGSASPSQWKLPRRAAVSSWLQAWCSWACLTSKPARDTSERVRSNMLRWYAAILWPLTT